MTLTCNTIQDLLPLWADDVLHPGSLEEVEAHLAACPACRKTARPSSSIRISSATACSAAST